jgi:hypothetical protein
MEKNGTSVNIFQNACYQLDKGGGKFKKAMELINSMQRRVEDFAKEIGAVHLMGDANWRQSYKKDYAQTDKIGLNMNKIYYLIYCMVLGSGTSQDKIDKNEFVPPYYDARMMLVSCIMLYVFAIYRYSGILILMTDNLNVQREICFSSLGVIALVVHLYFSKYEKEIVDRYRVMRKGQESEDGRIGFYILMSGVVLVPLYEAVNQFVPLPLLKNLIK